MVDPDPTLVVTDLADGVLVIRLNDPDQLNAISNLMRQQFAVALEAAKDEAVRAVVITGTGRSFSAGGDVKAAEKGTRSAHETRTRLQTSHRMLTTPLLTLEKPTIAAVNGIAAGAGVSIALCCDLRVVTRSSTWVMAFGALGLVPDMGIGYLLPRLIGLARAKEILMTHDRLSAEQADAYGLVTELVDDDCLQRAVELAKRLAARPFVAAGLTKRMLETSLDHSLSSFLELETTYQGIASQTPEHIAARTAFLAKGRANGRSATAPTPLARATAMYRKALPASGGGTLEDRREGYDSLLVTLPIPRDVTIETVSVGCVEAYWVDATGGTAERAAVLLHGGGYIIGSARGYRAYAAYVSRVTGARVLVPEYRRAPEHPYPAAIDDAMAAIDVAVAVAGPASTFVIGDSAGGGLTLSSLLASHELGRPPVAAAVLVSALVDLTVVNRSFVEKADEDPIVSSRGIRRAAEFYLGGRGPQEAPWAFPMERDLSALPPTLVMVGTAEVLLDDSRNLATKLGKDGATYEFSEYADMVHVWPLFASFLPEARDALEEIGAYVDQHVSGRSTGVGAAELAAWVSD